MSAEAAELTLGFNTATVLERVRWLPHVRLERRSDGVTAVRFHARTIALLDSERQRAEVAVHDTDLERMLAEHRDAERGPIGVTVRLTSPSRVQTAVELIERGVDEAMYRWQLTSSNP